MTIDISGSRLCLGTNVFGWTIDEGVSHEILDGYVQRGGDFIDTADNYSVWADGNPGGISESVVGTWLSDRGNREKLVVATKVGQMPDFPGYHEVDVREALDGSLARLQVDAVDIYYAHRDFDNLPLAEVARTFHRIVEDGKARAIGLSNFTPERVREWLEVCEAEGLVRPTVLQPHYNLMERHHVEEGLSVLAQDRQLSLVCYAGLARGFLTGRYRGGQGADSPRAYQAEGYRGEKGDRVLGALDEVSRKHGMSVATAALAWVLAKAGVTSTIVSVSRVGQLDDVMAAGATALDPDDIELLDRASDEP